MFVVLERIIADQLLFYLKSNELITEHKYGFLEKRSTEVQLLKFLKFWSDELIKGNFIDIIYFDFAKAFDTVSHPKLLIKLQSYGIKGNFLK